MSELIGIPDTTDAHLGIDALGDGCRIDSTVTVMRWGERDDARRGLIERDFAAMHIRHGDSVGQRRAAEHQHHEKQGKKLLGHIKVPPEIDCK